MITKHWAGAIALAGFLAASGAAEAFQSSATVSRGLTTVSSVTTVNRLMPYAGGAPDTSNAVQQRARRDQLRAAVERQRTAALGGAPTRSGRPSRQMDPAFLPKTVDFNGKYKPGTIVIDTEDKYLYHVGTNGQARRYGVGVGRPGFQWSGTHRVSMKKEWPGWTPPPAMRKRQPELPAYMEGGPENPLGARALYLGSTLYRIHGSNAPWTIGHEVSSGCIRMRNEDVIELYEQVKVGTPVVVLR